MHSDMKVLIVEDEQKLADSLAHGLVVLGHTADVLYDGQKALDRLTLHAEEYDIVVLDLMLPLKSGEEVCRAVRGLGISIPILIDSSSQSPISNQKRPPPSKSNMPYIAGGFILNCRLSAV